MRRWGILLGMVCGLLASCTSEYEERMSEAKALKMRLERVNEANQNIEDRHVNEEIEDIQSEILFLAKVSGNEELFLVELYRD